jgi:hypothetical protein
MLDVLQRRQQSVTTSTLFIENALHLGAPASDQDCDLAMFPFAKPHCEADRFCCQLSASPGWANSVYGRSRHVEVPIDKTLVILSPLTGHGEFSFSCSAQNCTASPRIQIRIQFWVKGDAKSIETVVTLNRQNPLWQPAKARSPIATSPCMPLVK